MQTGARKGQAPSYISNHNLHSSAHPRGISNSSFKHALCANETWDAVEELRSAACEPGLCPGLGQAVSAPLWRWESLGCGLTTAAAMAAVCAAMAVPFLAFWKPSVPQDVRANGWLSKLTTWMWVLQKDRGKGKKQAGTKLYSPFLAHLTGTADCRTSVSLSKHPTYSNLLQRPPSSDLLVTFHTQAGPFWRRCALSKYTSDPTQPFQTHLSLHFTSSIKKRGTKHF